LSPRHGRAVSMVCAPSLPTSVHIPRVDTGGAVEGALGAGRLAFVRRRIPPHHQGVPCVVLLLSSFIKSYKVSYVPSLITYRYTAIPLYRYTAIFYLLPPTCAMSRATCRCCPPVVCGSSYHRGRDHSERCGSPPLSETPSPTTIRNPQLIPHSIDSTTSTRAPRPSLSPHNQRSQRPPFNVYGFGNERRQ
jgi:hypothetical protein